MIYSTSQRMTATKLKNKKLIELKCALTVLGFRETNLQNHTNKFHNYTLGFIKVKILVWFGFMHVSLRHDPTETSFTGFNDCNEVLRKVTELIEKGYVDNTIEPGSDTKVKE